MITRLIEKKAEKLLKQFPAVGIIGPRQCGKTTIAKLLQKNGKSKAGVYFDLESPQDLRKFENPELFLTAHHDQQVIIDEVQRMPELFPLMRSLIDKKRQAGRFLLLGSASPELIKGSSESLAGRIYYLEATPFLLVELPNKSNTLIKHWFRGGFPGAWNAKSDEMYFLWMDGFARTFIERDLNQLFGVTFSPQIMFKLWRMLAHYHGGIWNAQSFAKGLGISSTTVNSYLDHLVGAFMVRKLQPYFFNTAKRLVKSPKVYIRDSGLLHYLLDIHHAKNLQYHPQLGYSWEGYVIEQIISLLPNTIQPYYYRTHDGAEVDLLLVKGIKPLASLEIKYSEKPSLSKGYSESVKDLNTKHNYFITPGKEKPWPLNKNIMAVGLNEFLVDVLPKIIK
ncbi:MAG: ATP-binding protein [Bacteroidia bacterium]|jgi:predicted AAA+ superfamily ATPase|nr:ATP-binding protein [Bacteroidia bacterium]